MKIDLVEFVDSPTPAYAAITSPLWLPSLSEISTFAGLILPILGAVWLTLQIGLKLYSLRKKDLE